MKSTSGNVVRTARPLGKVLVEVEEDIGSLWHGDYPSLCSSLPNAAFLLLPLPPFVPFLPRFSFFPASCCQMKTVVSGTGVAKPCDLQSHGSCSGHAGAAPGRWEQSPAVPKRAERARQVPGQGRVALG